MSLTHTGAAQASAAGQFYRDRDFTYAAKQALDELIEQAKEEAADRLQERLNTLSFIISFIPVVGTLASAALDLLNASISIARGNYYDAAFYGIAALPLVGDAAQGVRIGQTFARRASTGRGIAGLAAQGVAEGTVQLTIYYGIDWLASGGADNSFAAGTGVVTGFDVNGEPTTTDIATLQVGDVVLANDELNPDGEPHYALVTAVSSRTVYELHELTYVTDTGQFETLQTTTNHEFYAHRPAGPAGWTTADQLQPGDQLLLPDGTLATVTINTETAAPDGIEVYNLTVSDGSTYYVDDGQGDVAAAWVHNARRYRAILSIFGDSRNRVKQVTTTVTARNIGEGTRSTLAARAWVKLVGRSGDHAGHLIAKILGGRGALRSGNIIPINAKLNQGQMAKLEKRIANEVRNGATAHIKVSLRYQGFSFRPTRIAYQVQILKANGSIEYLRKSFPNA